MALPAATPACPAVLLDVLQGIPTAALVRLGPGEHFSQHAHVLLLQVRFRVDGNWVALPPAGSRAAQSSKCFAICVHLMVRPL